MMNLKIRSKAQASFLFVVLLALFLSGCIPTSGNITAQPVSVPAIDKGNIENGRNLFLGRVHFKYSGPPCMGCHSVGNNGLLGGGAMGPNLTDVSARLNQTELISILSNFGPKISPVMEPIYTEHPLTVSEQADLIVFLNASSGEAETDKELIVVALSLAGFAAGVVLLGIIYRGRVRGVRAPLVRKAREQEA